MQVNNTYYMHHGSKRIYLYIVIFLTAAVSWRINNVATRALGRTDTSTTNSTLEHKIGTDEPGTIWVVNQMKCGTGTLTNSIQSALNCIKVKIDVEVAIYDCFNEKKLFSAHNADMVTKIKKEASNETFQEGTKPSKCIAVTALRNPLHSIPSRFFHENWRRFCNGTQSEEEIIKEYEQFLLGPLPPYQVNTTANMLRAFGAQDILEAAEFLSEKGYAFLSQPDKDSPWAGCELLFLQIDYDESDSYLDDGFYHAVEGVKIKRDHVRAKTCPKAAHNYNAVQKYRIPDKLIHMYSKINPDFHDVMTYYQKYQANTQVGLSTEK